MEASPQYQDTNMNMAMPAVMPSDYGRNSAAIPNTQIGRFYGGGDMASLLQLMG